MSPAILPPILQLMLFPQDVLEQVRDEREQTVAVLERRGRGNDLMYAFILSDRPELDEVFARLVAVAVADWQWNPDQQPNVRLGHAVSHEGTAVVVRPKHLSETRLEELQRALTKSRAVPVSDHPLHELHWRMPMGLAAAMLTALREERERKPSRPNAVVGRQRTISMKGLLEFIAQNP